MNILSALMMGIMFADLLFGLLGEKGITKYMKLIDVAFTLVMFSLLYNGYHSLAYIGLVSLGFSMCMFIYRAQKEYTTEVIFSKTYNKLPKLIRSIMPVTAMNEEELEHFRTTVQVFYFVRIPKPKRLCVLKQH